MATSLRLLPSHPIKLIHLRLVPIVSSQWKSTFPNKEYADTVVPISSSMQAQSAEVTILTKAKCVWTNCYKLT